MTDETTTLNAPANTSVTPQATEKDYFRAAADVLKHALISPHNKIVNQALKAANKTEAEYSKHLPITEVYTMNNRTGFAPEQGNNMGVLVSVNKASEYDFDDVQKLLFGTLKTQMEKINVVDEKDGVPTTRTLASYYDFEHKVAQRWDEKEKEQKAVIKTEIDKIIAENPGQISEPLTKLLGDYLNPEKENHHWSYVDFPNDTVTTEFRFGHADEDNKGDLSIGASIEENIKARKAAILNAIQQDVADMHNKHMEQPDAKPFLTQADIDNLDLEVHFSGGGVAVKLGTKPDPNAKTPEGQEPKSAFESLGPTPLHTLSQEHLQRIVKENILLKGEGADQVISLIADGDDVRHMLKETSEKIPALNDVLKHDLFLDRKTRRENEKNGGNLNELLKLNIEATSDNHMFPDSFKVNIPLVPGLNPPALAVAFAGDNTEMKIDTELKAKHMKARDQGPMVAHAMAI